MLQTIREHTQGWIAGTIISIIILTFALWGIHSYFIGFGGNVNVAEVNGIDISKEQLAVAYERLRRQVQIQYGSNNPITTKNESALKGRALQSLVDIEVQKQASLSQGYRVFDRQIDHYLQSMPEFQINGQFSLARFQEILSTSLLSTSEFLELIKTSLLINQSKLGIIFTSFALPDETKHTIALINQERDIDYVSIPFKYFLSQPIVISQQKIQDYYDKNHSEFMRPEQANVEFVQLSLKDLSTKINPTDTMLKSFYNENINSYTQGMQWKYTSIEIPVSPNALHDELQQWQKKAITAAQAIRNGEDMAIVAKGLGGHLSNEGWLTLNRVPAEWQKALAAITKAGEVSDPFKTSKGIVIIKVVDIQQPTMQAFETVKNKVKEAYVHQHAEEKFAELRDQLANLSYEHPDSLQFVAKELNLPIQASELFTKEKGGRDISQYKKVRDAAFSNDVLNLQNNSDVVQLNPETAIVLRAKSHIASTLLPLNSISSKQIEDKLKSREAESLTAKFAEDLQAKLQSGADPQPLINSYKLKWNSTGLIGRYSKKVDPAILDMAFRLPNPAVTKNRMTYGVARLPNGFAIVALKSVKEGASVNSKDISVFSEQIQNSEGLLEYELYKRSQASNARIKMNVSNPG